MVHLLQLPEAVGVQRAVAAHQVQLAQQLDRLPREQLAPYKRPRRVRYVDALPRNALGKVLRTEL